MIIFVLETSFLFWGLHLYNKEYENTNICYYDICSDYPDAFYSEEVCTCYDYDLFGEYAVAKEEYMG